MTEREQADIQKSRRSLEDDENRYKKVLHAKRSSEVNGSEFCSSEVFRLITHQT